MVRIRLPCVKREDGHFYGESYTQRPENNSLLSCRKALTCGIQRADLKGVRARRLKIEIDHANEDDETSCQCIDEKFQGDRSAVDTTPPKANEINGYERHFPEDVEKETVKRAEHSDQCHLHKQDQPVKGRSILV